MNEDKVTDLYTLFGVTADFTDEELLESYNALRLTYHPDKPTGDLDKYNKIVEGYKILSDKDRKIKYKNALMSTFIELKKDYKIPLQYEKITEDAINNFNGVKDDYFNKTIEKLKYVPKNDKSVEELEAQYKSLLLERNEDENEFIKENETNFLTEKFDLNDFNQVFMICKKEMGLSNRTDIKQIEMESYSNTQCNEVASYDLYERNDGKPLFLAESSEKWNDSFTKDAFIIKNITKDSIPKENIINVYAESPNVIENKMDDFLKNRKEDLYTKNYIIDANFDKYMI